jgi:hypothetical protein
MRSVWRMSSGRFDSFDSTVSVARLVPITISLNSYAFPVSVSLQLVYTDFIANHNRPHSDTHHLRVGFDSVGLDAHTWVP